MCRSGACRSSGTASCRYELKREGLNVTDYMNGCLECGTTTERIIRGYCQGCWPQIRRENKAYKEGYRAATTDADNPYDEATDYKTWIVWEMGYWDAMEKEDKQL